MWLTRLAIWYLRKKEYSVIINCKFKQPFDVDINDTLIHYHNDYVDGTMFHRENGTKMVMTTKG